MTFAPGNLQAVIGSYTDPITTASSWKFAEHQYDYIGNAAGNTSLAAGTTVDLFGWVGASASYDSYGLCTNTYANNAYFGTSESDALKTDWGSIPGVVSVCGDGWYTLSSAEWKYVISERTSVATVNGTPNARYTEAIINTDGTGVNGVILFPDGVTFAAGEATTWGAINNTSNWATKCTTSQWSALESKGCVFLPAAGLRDGTSVLYAGSSGGYWSGTPDSGNDMNALCVNFYSGYMYPNNTYYRYRGCSVRLAKVYKGGMSGNTLYLSGDISTDNDELTITGVGSGWAGISGWTSAEVYVNGEQFDYDSTYIEVPFYSLYYRKTGVGSLCVECNDEWTPTSCSFSLYII